MERYDLALIIELDAGAVPLPERCAHGKKQGFDVGPQQTGRRGRRKDCPERLSVFIVHGQMVSLYGIKSSAAGFGKSLWLYVPPTCPLLEKRKNVKASFATDILYTEQFDKIQAPSYIKEGLIWLQKCLNNKIRK